MPVNGDLRQRTYVYLELILSLDVLGKNIIEAVYAFDNEHLSRSERCYPLTEDLKYIIQQRGEYVGWWDIENNGYMFKDANGNNMTNINAEIAWLFMCCYAE